MTDFTFDIDLWHTWTDVIFWSLTILGFITAFVAYNSYDVRREEHTGIYSAALMLILLFMLGLFPIEWGWSSDRENYANIFLNIQNNPAYESRIEGGFMYINRIIGMLTDVKAYLFIIAFIYLGNYLIASRRLVKGKSIWLLIAIVISMGFTSYYLNTMRAGLALSFVLLAISFYPSRWKMLIFLAIAVSIHTSTIIPGAILFACTFYNNPRLFYALWFLSIPASLIFGGYFMEIFAGMSSDTRSSYLTGGSESGYNVGFRIDFILYSLAPMAVGAYYIFRQEFKDKLYVLIYNTYVLTNIFWVLVIKADFSDRFAYLSWFLIPIVLTYPLLTRKLQLKENIWLATIILGETLFRFIFA